RGPGGLMTGDQDWIVPDWPAPAGVRAVSTTRTGGVSTGPYASLNLAGHVGDDPANVAANRVRLRERLQLPAGPAWLEQIHGTGILDLDAEPPGPADGALATRPGRVCVVMTADCLPLLLCSRAGDRVAAVHAGWRGLAAGVIEAALDRLAGRGEALLAWLGPAIGPTAFAVGEEVRAAFLRHDPRAAQAFQRRDGELYADLYTLARQRLAAHGVTAVYGGGRCTWSEPEQFYSYRRDGTTGRMASLIWLG
ncbi:MAG TPA: peptidoglycan editing factor PgeF, partial [Thiohalobacter sp.]|nr:peptidoglycan editing factor PgeF [Thiohalobacter sp.]